MTRRQRKAFIRDGRERRRKKVMPGSAAYMDELAKGINEAVRQLFPLVDDERWQNVDRSTRIFVEAETVVVETLRDDLDQAMDDAAQYFGEPLEQGPWRDERGREEFFTSRRLTCRAWPSAKAHEEEDRS